MEEQNNKNLPDASAQETEEAVQFTTAPIDVEYCAGQRANDIDGNAVDDDAFDFVQKDKKISDVKFTTKPTTFFKDAMRRFRKNRSSVAGGIILGVLFLLALILPINGVLPYDIKNTHNYETNLPMKLFPASNGFWDGTKMYKNQAYPYATEADGSRGEYIGEYADDSAIVSVSNIHDGYQNTSSKDGHGGYVRVYKDPTETGMGMLYSASYAYSLSNNYSISYTLGWTLEENSKVTKPEYAVFIRTNTGDSSNNNNKNFALTEFTSDYGELGEAADEYATIASYPTQTLDLTAAIKAKRDSGEIPAACLNSGYSVGFEFKADANKGTALYLKNFQITSSAAKDKAQMAARSFGVEGAKIADANALVQISDTSSSSYWASITDQRYDSYDTAITSCDILYDMYELAYGWRNDASPLSQGIFEDWIEKGYIDYPSVDKITVGALKITEAGEASGEVYVRSVNEIIRAQDPNDASITIYSFRSTVLMYKYLGYSSMPIHVFGTEKFGKDLLKYVFSGLRTSLILGIIVSAINITFGVIWGSISGYFGGWTDLLMERFTDILSGIPWIVLMTVLTLKLGQTFFVFALALCLTGWIGTEATTRSQFYRYKGREYVLAARTLGAKSPRLIFRHILPNAIGTIVTGAVLMIPSVIFSEATISFLGLGLQNLDSLGVILSRAEQTFQSYPYQLIIPSIIISLLMICFNLFGNGLRDAFNPSLKGSE